MSNFAVFACGWKSLIRSQPKKQYEKKNKKKRTNKNPK